MVFSLRGWLNVFPVMKDVFMRFPLALIFIISSTVLSLLLAHKIELFDKEIIGVIYTVLVFGLVSQVSFRLFSESENWNTKKYLIGSWLILLLIVFYTVVLFDKSSPVSSLFFSLALLLSLMFAPYIRRQSDENSVWYFNYQTGVALFFAALSAIVFGGGLSLVLLSTGYLFEIKVPGIIYADIWIVAWSVLFTVYVLSNISKVYVYKDESCDFPKGISFIANYILAPLMLAYMAVLYAYFFKIVLQWELPKGNLGWMVSSFGIIGIVTKLVAYPIRDKGTRLMALFDKYFYYALVVPALMLFIAIFVRIDEYGVTEQRYAVVLLGIWFALVIAATVFIKDRFHIKYIPMSLAILVLLASYGPLSAIEVSVNSQLARFESLLIKNNLLFNGQVVKSRKKVSFEDRKVLSSIADYLGGNKWRSDKTRSMFNSLLAEEKNKDLSESKKISGTGFIALLGIDHVSKWDARRAEKVNNFSYKNSFDLNQILINVSGFDYVGRHYFYFYSNSDKKKVFTLNRNNKNEDIKVEINENFFSINSKTGGRIEFDLGSFVLDLRERGIRDTSQSNSSELTLNKSSSDGRLKVRLIIEQLNGKIRKKNDVDLTNIRYTLMLGFN